MLTTLTLLVGCGGGDSLRQTLEGEVTVDHAKVAEGSISFLPQGETVGPAASTAIVDGTYQFGQHNGPYAGDHRVVVGVVSLANQEATGASTVDASAASVKAKTGPASPPSRTRPAASRQESSESWTTEYVIPPSGPGRKNFDFVTPPP